jgi:photosystem II stability/assembly factor-like uncharacterized protein
LLLADHTVENARFSPRIGHLGHMFTKPTLILGLALVLSGGLFGCSNFSEHFAKIHREAEETATRISGIQMLDASDGWAMTPWDTHLPLLLSTADSGESWTDRTPRMVRKGKFIMQGFYFFDAQNGWVCAYEGKYLNNGELMPLAGLLHTTNGGKAWSFFKTPTLSIAGDYCCYYETNAAEKNWKPIINNPVEADPTEHLPSGPIYLCRLAGETVAYYPPAKVIIPNRPKLGEHQKVAVSLSVSTNLGKTWCDQTLPLPSAKLHESLVNWDPPIFLDGKNGWLYAYFNMTTNGVDNDAGATAFYTTDDGGETWKPRPGIVEGDCDIFDFVSPEEAFVCSGTNLYVTHNAAKSWQTIAHDVDFGGDSSHRAVSQVDFVDGTHGWVLIREIGGNGAAHYDYEFLYKTTDGGATWKNLPEKIMPQINRSVPKKS